MTNLECYELYKGKSAAVTMNNGEVTYGKVIGYAEKSRLVGKLNGKRMDLPLMVIMLDHRSKGHHFYYSDNLYERVIIPDERYRVEGQRIAYVSESNIQFPDMPEELMFGHLGSGTTVWNLRIEVANNECLQVAHISDSGKIKYYCEISENAKKHIEAFAADQK